MLCAARSPSEQISNHTSLYWWTEHTARGMEYVAQGQLTLAEREFNWAIATVPKPYSAETLLHMGSMLKYKDKGKAILAFEQSFGRRPDLVHAGMELGLMYQEDGNALKAKEILEEVVRQAPGWVDAWVHLGFMHYSTESYEGAQLAWQQALELDPLHPQARRNIQLLEQTRP